MSYGVGYMLKFMEKWAVIESAAKFFRSPGGHSFVTLLLQCSPLSNNQKDDFIQLLFRFII